MLPPVPSNHILAVRPWPSRLAVVAAIAAGALATTAADASAASVTKGKPGVRVTVEQRALLVRGTRGDDTIALRLRAGRPDILEVDAGGGAGAGTQVERRLFDRILVDARGGADAVRIDDSNGAFTDAEPATIDGGSGADTLLGGSGAERLVGGRGADFVDGGAGADAAFLGAGDDVFRWDPGEGSDAVEGDAGHDVMRFNGANIGESFDVSANGQRVRFFRNVGNITMDLDGVEQIDTAALGGADTLTQHDVSGTDLTSENVDLAGAPGGTAGDGQPDSVVVAGTNGDDVADVAGDAAAVGVSGVSAGVRIAHPESGDALAVDALAGDDVIEASGLAAGTLRFTASGGDGDDVLIGSAGADVLNGDAGDDVLIGGPGVDALDGGSGDNVVVQ